MDKHILSAFEDAQARTIALTERLMRSLSPGTSELALSRLADTLLHEYGFNAWFRAPVVRFGARTRALGACSDRSRVETGRHVLLRLSPRGDACFGDHACSFVFRSADSELVQAARACTTTTAGYAHPTRCEGEILVYARAWAVNHRLELADPDLAGYRVPELESLAQGSPEFLRGLLLRPRTAELLTHLRRYRLHFLNPRRLHGLYVIAPHLVHGDHGACFSELVHVGPEGTRLLGRTEIESPPAA